MHCPHYFELLRQPRLPGQPEEVRGTARRRRSATSCRRHDAPQCVTASRPDDRLRAAATLMVDHKFNRVPVVDDDALVGIVDASRHHQAAGALRCSHGRERALAHGRPRRRCATTSPAWARCCRPATALCAVVKANGYGHGAVPVARAALRAGSSWLGVASVAEAEELREAGLPRRSSSSAPLTGAELRARRRGRRRRGRLVGGVPRRGAPRRARGCTSSSTRAWAGWACDGA